MRYSQGDGVHTSLDWLVLYPRSVGCVLVIGVVVVVVIVGFLTLTDPLRIQPWSQDSRNQTKSIDKHGKQTEENGQGSSQQRTSSR